MKRTLFYPIRTVERRSLFCVWMLWIAAVSFAQPPDTAWTRTYGTDQIPTDLWSVIETQDGGYVMVGATGNDGCGYLCDGYIRKVDSDGNELWYHTTDLWPDFLNGWLYNCVELNDGTIVACGRMTRGTDNGAFVMAVDSNGDTLWTRQVLENSREFRFVRVDSQGSIYVSGFARTLDIQRFPCAAKLSADGQLLWYREYPEFAPFTNPWRFSCTVTQEDNLIITGSGRDTTLSDESYIRLLEVDSNGDSLRTQILIADSGGHFARDIISLSNGGYVVAARTAIGDHTTLYFGTLIGLNSALEPIWTRLFDENWIDSFLQNLVALDDGSFILGHHVDFLFNPPFGRRYEAKFVRFSGLGDPIWETTFVIGGVDNVDGVISPTADGGFICGWEVGLTDPYVVLARMDEDTLGINRDSPHYLTSTAFELKPPFPNPFNGELNIQFNVYKQENLQVQVYNVLGQLIMNSRMQSYEPGIHTYYLESSQLSSGPMVITLNSLSQTEAVTIYHLK